MSVLTFPSFQLTSTLRCLMTCLVTSQATSYWLTVPGSPQQGLLILKKCV